MIVLEWVIIIEPSSPLEVNVVNPVECEVTILVSSSDDSLPLTVVGSSKS